MISIVFGTHNRLGKLKQAMESIHKAAQNIKGYEIIIIDGGSTDGTLEYLNTQKHTKVINEGGLHGVTRAYNRGFRLATQPYLTWFSDDFIYDEKALEVLAIRLAEVDSKTLLSLSIDVKDGKGFKNYAPNTPIGAGHTKLFQSVDYWSEDFITYASDNDFSQKIHMSGGKVIAEPSAKLTHNIDLKDDLHNENLSHNPCSARYRELYKGGIKGFNKTYPDVWINARNADDLYAKIQNVRSNIGWCNFYTANLFNHEALFSSMNIRVGSRDKNYAKEV